jgi:heme-degrading monooxygenase HmoA
MELRRVKNIWKICSISEVVINLFMITRVWHGRTALAHADSYLEFLLTKGTADYKKITGNLSVRVWRRLETDCCHFCTVTEWEDLASIKQFAGEQHEKAVYYPEDEGILLEFEDHVLHYESYVV